MPAAPYRDMDQYATYLRSIPDERYTKEEAAELKAAGDVDALFESVASMVPFIIQRDVSDAFRRENYQDMVQEGNLAILQAISSWEPGPSNMALSSWAYMYIRKAVIREMQRDIKWHGQHMSMDFCIDMDELDDTLQDAITDDGQWEQDQEAKARYRAIVNSLPRRDQVMMSMLLEGHTQALIAATIGVSQSRVSRVIGDVFKRIRNGPEA